MASYATAAHATRLPVPQILQAERRVHLTWPAGAHQTQRKDIVSHRQSLSPCDTTTLLGIPVTTPARTWVDLSGDPRLNDIDLVVLADAIIKRPWRKGRRVDALDTLDGLAATIQRAGRVKGVRRARLALERARIGADSPQETRTRLALVDAGLPEPDLQVRADPADPYSPAADLGYRDLKLAIQYDGEHHRTREQQAIDADRDRAFQERGWTVIRLTWLDQKQGFTRLIREVRSRFDAMQRA
ncbi:DUF559 domain-containing protein [Cellulosimicrobium funkei]|nr:DUF559 domain-containing protein [Cellulosimicrobium funkei]